MLTPYSNYLPLADGTVELLLSQLFDNAGALEMCRAYRIAKDRAHYKALSEAQAATIANLEAERDALRVELADMTKRHDELRKEWLDSLRKSCPECGC